jgi:AraC family transcriptional regulator
VPLSRSGGFRAAKVSRKLHVRSWVNVATLVALQLKAIPFIEQFFGNKKVSSGSYPIGGVSAIDLQDEPAVLLPNPFDALVLYVTQAALDEIAYAHQASQVEHLGVATGSI